MFHVVACFLFMKEKRFAKVLQSSSELSKQTEEKISSKMATTLKNREMQLQQLVDKLKIHNVGLEKF